MGHASVILVRLLRRATLRGLTFITVGTAAGVIRGETFSASYWATDLMVLLSLAAWVACLVLIGGRVRGGWSGAADPYLRGPHTCGG